MSRHLTDVELAAWRGLLHAHEQITRSLDAELRSQHNISLSDYDVLVRLAQRRPEGMRMSDLAREMLFSPSGLTRVVDRLVANGLAQRARDAADARVVVAGITAPGLHRIRGASRTHLRGIREHFTRHLTERQLKAVGSALQVITGPLPDH